MWLKGNRRAGTLLAIPLLVVLASAVATTYSAWGTSWKWLGVGAGALSLIGLGLVIWYIRLPRIASQGGNLLLYLRGWAPLPVPLDVVECFFLGQGASMLPRPLEGKQGEASETSTVVVRLAESAKEWHHRDVRGFLGQWCEGYITVRGTWCEPLNAEVMGRLNRLLVEEHRRIRTASQEPVSA